LDWLLANPEHKDAAALERHTILRKVGKGAGTQVSTCSPHRSSSTGSSNGCLNSNTCTA